jgi:glycosyltransferase involved in cell wall biosynthesis
VILRPQNVENLVWKRYLKGSINPFKRGYLQIATNRLMNFEMQMATQVDGIIAISEPDACTFREYSPDTPCTTVPVGFDFSTVSTSEIHKQFGNFPVFYHLGSMDWRPNVQGIKWFIEEVLPFVAIDYPEFVFRIAGKNMPEWFFKQQGKNLVVDRDVPDSQIYHSDKPVMIVPILSGGGLRVKIIEAMALGKTVISTTIGAEGIPYTDQENILIADNKEDFAIQIKKCRDSKELCQTIGRNAQKLAMENFDCSKTAAKMILFYEKMLESVPTADFHGTLSLLHPTPKRLSEKSFVTAEAQRRREV